MYINKIKIRKLYSILCISHFDAVDYKYSFESENKKNKILPIYTFTYLCIIFLLTCYNCKCYFNYVTDVESNAGNQRVKIEDHDPSVQSWNISDYCTPTSAPVTEEYHVIVKEGCGSLLLISK